jgi:hypothetical protein
MGPTFRRRNKREAEFTTENTARPGGRNQNFDASQTDVKSFLSMASRTAPEKIFARREEVGD